MKELSECCKASMTVGGDVFEGTRHYVCTKCNNICDRAVADTPDMSDETFLDDEFFDAEYKLQNHIRITTLVESFTTEVYTGLRWIPVTEYVVGLIKYTERVTEEKFGKHAL